MLNPRPRSPTKLFNKVHISDSGLVVEWNDHTVTAVTLDRLAALYEIVDSPDLARYSISPDHRYLCWDTYGIRLSYYDIMEAVNGTNIWDNRPFETKLCQQSLELDQTGDTKEAISIARLAYLISKENRDIPAVGTNAGNLGMFHANLGQREQAKKYLLIALDCTKPAGYDELRANALGNLGVIAVEEGAYETGISLLTNALELHAEGRNYIGQSISYGEIGTAYAQKGEFLLARSFYERALASAERANNDALIERWSAYLRFICSIKPQDYPHYKDIIKEMVTLFRNSQKDSP